tara:strand:+ start:117 stop:320 length:204 start_codon:yes stop_codon:yes gene_type:complete
VEEVALSGEVAQVVVEDLAEEVAQVVVEDLVAEEGGRAIWNPTGQMLQILKAQRYRKNGSKLMKMLD